MVLRGSEYSESVEVNLSDGFPYPVAVRVGGSRRQTEKLKLSFLRAFLRLLFLELWALVKKWTTFWAPFSVFWAKSSRALGLQRVNSF